MSLNVMTMCDYYKLGHLVMNPPGVEQTVSTWTPRYHNHDNPYNTYTVHFGSQYVVQRFFQEIFDEFFETDFLVWKTDFQKTVTRTFDNRYIDPIIKKFAKLHRLGYLPIAVYSVPEGMLIADGVPTVVIFNTHKDFAFLPQFLEDMWSSHSWHPATSATTAYYRRKSAEQYFEQSDDPSRIRMLCGDFSLRGHTGHEAAAISSLGHLLSFDRTATIDANRMAREYYGADIKEGAIGYGMPSVEHSVVEQNVAYYEHLITNNDKLNTYGAVADLPLRLAAEGMTIIKLITEVQPTANLSYVADTYDYWGIITEVLPRIKHIIMERKGKLFIRPDSGDPVKIILGDPDALTIHERKGTLTMLAEIFGTTENDSFYSLLHPSIGLIYGDAITAERQEQILEGMLKKGFAADNIALGIGAYTYQYVTRDTRGFAIKATHSVMSDIGEVYLQKAPKTDVQKKSQKGLPIVEFENEHLVLDYTDGHTFSEFLSSVRNIMRPIFINGKIMNMETIHVIRHRLWGGNF